MNKNIFWPNRVVKMSGKLVGFAQKDEAVIVRVRYIWISHFAFSWIDCNPNWIAPNGWKFVVGCNRSITSYHHVDGNIRYQLNLTGSEYNVTDLAARIPEAVQHFAGIQQALTALAEAVAKTSPQSPALSELTLIPATSGPLVGFQAEDRPVIVKKTFIFLSKEVYAFLKNLKTDKYHKPTMGWTSSRGVRIQISSRWHIACWGETVDRASFYIPKSAFGEVSNLSECVNFENSPLTFSGLTEALKELADLCRAEKAQKVARVDDIVDGLTYY
jgi:hypothetical protein